MTDRQVPVNSLVFWDLQFLELLATIYFICIHHVKYFQNIYLVWFLNRIFNYYNVVTNVELLLMYVHA